MAAESSASAAKRVRGRTVLLVSSDGHELQLSVSEASLSTLLHDWLDSVSDDARRFTLPSLEGLTATTLRKVARYLKAHAAAAATTAAANSSRSPAAVDREEDLREFDAAFIDVDQAMLYDLIMAANYLAIEGLLDLACKRVAAMITGKMPEQIRRAFHIKNDFTADEEAQIRRESPWLFGN